MYALSFILFTQQTQRHAVAKLTLCSSEFIIIPHTVEPQWQKVLFWYISMIQSKDCGIFKLGIDISLLGLPWQSITNLVTYHKCIISWFWIKSGIKMSVGSSFLWKRKERLSQISVLASGSFLTCGSVSTIFIRLSPWVHIYLCVQIFPLYRTPVILD